MGNKIGYYETSSYNLDIYDNTLIDDLEHFIKSPDYLENYLKFSQILESTFLRETINLEEKEIVKNGIKYSFYIKNRNIYLKREILNPTKITEVKKNEDGRKRKSKRKYKSKRKSKSRRKSKSKRKSNN